MNIESRINGRRVLSEPVGSSAHDMLFVAVGRLKIAVAPIFFLVLLLLGCSKEGGRQAYPSQEPAARSQAPENSPSSIRIVAFGPTSARVGQPFNQQANRSSAMWFKLDRAVDGLNIVLRFGSHTFRPVSHGDVVTVEVPPVLISSPGSISIIVEIVPTVGAIVDSNVVVLHVQ
ncbi:hypothetical protein L2Y94_04010 [Luteibacter aegosomatis]|uniref:hypothetical protein n=1 Tax=Luteibacter aegosomatis TaxID=2911537 RepID=UPI001FF82176|nr:hypothetical protein [Luteibacter aegosomatis]UPG86532.1 hypothetical protein L2Y94_04010 [Luteibacter aegosomatis]